MPGNDGRTLILLPDDVAPVRTAGHAALRAPVQTTNDDETSARAHGRSERAFAAALAALREAHAGEIARMTERVTRAEMQTEHLRVQLTVFEGRIEIEKAQTETLRAQLDVFEGRLGTETARADDLQGQLAEAEQAREAARKRAHELANRMMKLEAEAEEGRETKERLASLDGLLADAEQRLAESDTARRTTQERLDAMDRADAARRGKGRWARLQAAWRGE
jgi:chromosome segregation ATPase